MVMTITTFQYLIDRYNGSPTNNAVVSGVIDMIFGKGSMLRTQAETQRATCSCVSSSRTANSRRSSMTTTC
jgi:hypothetical protein